MRSILFACMYVHCMYAKCPQRSEVKLQMVVNHHMGVVESSARVESALKH